MPEQSINIGVGGDAKKILAEYDKVLKKQDQVIGRLKQTVAESRKAGRQNTRSFGAGALRQVAGLAAGYLSVSAAINVITKSLRAMAAERKKGAAGIAAAERPFSKLRQLAQTPEELRSLLKDVKLTRRGQGLGVEQAVDLVFQLESQGLRDKRGLFAKSSRFTSAGDLVESVGTAQAAFGREQTGGARAVINQLLAGSAGSKTTLGQLAPALTVAGGQATLVGGKFDETIALVSVLAKAAKSADVGGTRVGAFAGGFIGKKGFEGTLIEKFLKLRAMNLSPEGKKKFFGRKEGLIAFGDIERNFEEITATIASVRAARAKTGPGDRFARATTVTDERLEAAHELRRSVQGRKIAEEERLGPDEIRRQIILNRAAEASILSGESAGGRLARLVPARAAAGLGLSPETVEELAEVERIPGFEVIRGLDWTRAPSIEITTEEGLRAAVRSQNDK